MLLLSPFCYIAVGYRRVARYYESAIGRFTTVDPLAEKYYSISPYAYCNNNPIKYIDPTGEDYTIYFQRDEDNNLTGIEIRAEIYITGVNASEERAKELNILAKNIYNSQNIKRDCSLI